MISLVSKRTLLTNRGSVVTSTCPRGDYEAFAAAATPAPLPFASFAPFPALTLWVSKHVFHLFDYRYFFFRLSQQVTTDAIVAVAYRGSDFRGRPRSCPPENASWYPLTIFLRRRSAAANIRIPLCYFSYPGPCRPYIGTLLQCSAVGF